MGAPFDYKFAKRAVLGAFVMFAGSALASCSGGGGGGGSAVSPVAPSTPPNSGGTTGGTPTGGSGGGTATPPQSTLKVVEYPLPSSTSAAADITAGPDGNMWFSEGVFAKVGKITTSGAITEYAVGGVLSNGTTVLPSGLVTGADGEIYVTGGPATYQVSPSGKSATITALSSINSFNITVGPDHNLWITDAVNTQIVVANTSTIVAIYPVPIPHDTTTFAPDIAQITVGGDGALWFTEPNANSIGRVTTNGTFSMFPIPTPGSRPNGITAGPDGNVWFTETLQSAGGIGYVTPSGQVHEIPTTRHSFAEIVSGPDGNLWASSGLSNEIARISTSGQATYFPVSSRKIGDPGGIAVGVDGNIWFVEPNAFMIGKVIIH